MAKKSPEKKKSKFIKIRITEDDYNLIKSNQEIYGYGTLTRYLTAAGIGKLEGFKPPRNRRTAKMTTEETMQMFLHKVTGVVERYNFIYDSMATLIPQLKEIRERRQYLIQMARLNQETKKLVKVFKEIKKIRLESLDELEEEFQYDDDEIDY